MPLVQFVFLMVMVVSFFLFIVSPMILRLTLDRRVRKALPEDKVYDSPLDLYGGIMRAMGFGYAVVFERAKRYAIKNYYDGFDVKAFATPFEKAVSYTFVASLFLMIFSIVVIAITKWLGIFQWSLS